jgi:uncharacterized membrane protein YuzA (DUF378 family)
VFSLLSMFCSIVRLYHRALYCVHVYMIYYMEFKGPLLLFNFKNLRYMSMSCHSHGKCGPSRFGWFLVIIGGLNWGLVGLGMLMGSDWNVVGMLLGAWPTVLAIVYLLVGIATLVSICGCPCKRCKEARGNCMDCKAPTDKPLTPMSGASM